VSKLRRVCLVFFTAKRFTRLLWFALNPYQKVGEQTNKKESVSTDRLVTLEKIFKTALPISQLMINIKYGQFKRNRFVIDNSHNRFKANRSNTQI